MFRPKYTISSQLLANIKRITELVTGLNSRSYPSLVLARLEKRAISISAHASTSIEGNPLPLTDVKELLRHHPKHLRDTEREVLNYNQALEALNKLTGKKDAEVNLKLILVTQKQVVGGLAPRAWVGKMRRDAVIVNDPRVRKPVYLPPDYQDVPKLMAELLRYLSEQKIETDPLILAGLFHKQFVLIHPFMDGNGRTARLITKLFLARMGLNTFNLFSFENYYNQNVTAYFQNVGAFGNYYELAEDIEYTLWLEYFTGGIIDELLRVQAELSTLSAHPASLIRPHHKVILDFIKENGSITPGQYAKLTSRSRASRAVDFRRLLELGLIRSHGQGKALYYTLTED